MKNIEILQTQNADWGFWGTSLSNGYDAEMTWNVASRFLAEEFGLTPEEVRNVLDARFGRHLADDLSFTDTASAEAIAKHLKARIADAKWRKNFETSISEVTGKVFAQPKPAQADATLEGLLETLDLSNPSLDTIKNAIEAAYAAGLKAQK